MKLYIPSYIKTKNRMMIFDLFRSHSIMSRAEIVRITGMSFPTVLKVIDKLLQLGILIELEEMEQPSGAGRRGHLLRFNSRAYYAIGIEFEGRIVNMGLVDLHGNCQYPRKIYLSIRDQKLDLSNLTLEINHFMELAKKEGVPLLGIGIGFPAMINPQDKIILHMSSLNIFEPIPFHEAFPAFTDALTLPYFIGNDVNFACKGEAYLRYNNAHHNLLYVTLGSGCGAGIMLNGELWNGSTFKSGEIGNMLIPNQLFGESEVQGSTNFENLINLEAISKRFHINLQQEDVLQDDLCREICDYLCPYLAYMFVNLSYLLDIQNCVLTGLIPNVLGRTLYEKLQEAIRKLTNVAPLKIEASISHHSGVIGAAITALDQCLEELFNE